MHQPDVAIIDVKMPAGGGPRAARAIRTCSEQTRVLALSAYGDRESVRQMLLAGAVGYLIKGASIEDITNVVERAAHGEVMLAGEVADDLLGDFARGLERDEREAARRGRITRENTKVLDRGGPEILFQPIVELDAGRAVGVEALARFPSNLSRSPDVWFAEAHGVGMGVDLELAALTRALDAAQGLDSALFVAVNLSPVALMSRRIRAAMRRLCSDRLVVEVTEHAPVSDYPALGGAVDELRLRGGRLAVDDVGAGFASLRHILRLGPDLIKLDVELTRFIDADPACHALASGLTSFASATGASVVAEGFETPNQYETLLALGVAYGQGYLLGRPEHRRDMPPVRLPRVVPESRE